MSEPTYRSVADPAILSPRERDATTGRRISDRSEKHRRSGRARPRTRRVVLVGAVVVAALALGGLAVALSSGSDTPEEPAAAGPGQEDRGDGGATDRSSGPRPPEPGTSGGGEGDIDLAEVDPCTLLDDAALTRVTGATGLVTSGATGIAALTCFWAVPVPGEPAYAELTIDRGDEPVAGVCPTSPLDGTGGAAAGGICTASNQRKVYASVADRGVVMSLLINEPEAAVTPAALVSEMESIIAAL